MSRGQGEQARGARREAAEADIIIKSGRQIVRPLRNKFDSALERERASVRARVCVCVCVVFLLYSCASSKGSWQKEEQEEQKEKQQHKAD